MKSELITHTNRKIALILAGGALTLALAGGVQSWAVPSAALAQAAEAAEETHALPANQMIDSIRTAVASRPGRVREAEVDHENGKLVCEVKIIGNDGKTYKVNVDPAINRVISTELDD